MAGDSDNGDGNGDDSLKLRELIEGLPQELQDIIYDMTFTADPKVHIYACAQDVYWCKLDELVAECSNRAVEIGNWAYPHPHLLRVDRHSRQKFASSYYGSDSVFVIYSPLQWKFVEYMGSLKDHISDPRLVTGDHNALVQDFSDTNNRASLVLLGLDPAFVSRLSFITHHQVVKLVKERADAEVTETP